LAALEKGTHLLLLHVKQFSFEQHSSQLQEYTGHESMRSVGQTKFVKETLAGRHETRASGKHQ
jgi:hypothetical protein